MHAKPAPQTHRRTDLAKLLDFASFPLRALVLIERDGFGLSSLASERFRYAAGEVRGRCLDVGCGRHNRFVGGFLGGNGTGIDVHAWEGLADSQILRDPSRFPFEDASFDTVTFIASLNHVPAPLRDVELLEAHRCLRPGGNIVVTMGNPLAEILIHVLVRLYDRLLGTTLDVDGERGMHEDEAYYLVDAEIRDRLARARFTCIRKRYFVTQWFLNHMFIAWKPARADASAGERGPENDE